MAARFDEIEQELGALSAVRQTRRDHLHHKGKHPALSLLQPALQRILPDYSDLKVELVDDHGPVDIVAVGFDAGVRLGEQVARA
jgi:DNA-binding transcriptional LysR family regulator